MPLDLIILAWIDLFGETIGWIIRLALISLGLFLYYTYDQPDEEDNEAL